MTIITYLFLNEIDIKTYEKCVLFCFLKIKSCKYVHLILSTFVLTFGVCHFNQEVILNKNRHYVVYIQTEMF